MYGAFLPLTAGIASGRGAARTGVLHLPGVRPGTDARALRHACATQLVAEGLSLKQIGEHPGHRSAYATRTYAKVDLARLRQVADLALEDLP